MQPKKEQYRRKLPHFQQPGQWYSVTFTLKGAMPKGAMAKYASVLETARTRYQLLVQEAARRESDFPKSDKKLSGLGISGLGNQESRESESRESEFPNSDTKLAEAKKEYQINLRKYRLAYDKILNKSVLPGINLCNENNRKIIEEALSFWEGKRLTSHAWCIMQNHIHWIITVFEKEVGVGLSKSDNSTWESRSPKEKPVYLQDILHSVKLFTARRINENENRTGQLWEEESFETTIRNDRHFVNVINYVLNNPVSAGLVANRDDWKGSRSFGSRSFPTPT